MTRDYRRGAPPSAPKRREPKPCFFWFVLGGVLGAFAVGLAWTTQNPAGKSHGAAPSHQTQAESAGPSFSFYDILPEMEVAVPEDEALPPATQPPRPPSVQARRFEPTTEESVEPPSATSADARGGYLVQVASFRRPGEARRLKERLAGMGVQAHIQTVTINNEDTYHRVRTGPLSSRAQIKEIRDRLTREGLDSITIKVK